MNTQKIKLTNLETKLLNEIVSMYDEDCNMCFTRTLTQSEKGVISSLVKKGLVYDSFEFDKHLQNLSRVEHNYFPSEI